MLKLDEGVWLGSVSGGRGGRKKVLIGHSIPRSPALLGRRHVHPDCHRVISRSAQMTRPPCPPLRRLWYRRRRRATPLCGYRRLAGLGVEGKGSTWRRKQASVHPICRRLQVSAAFSISLSWFPIRQPQPTARGGMSHWSVARASPLPVGVHIAITPLVSALLSIPIPTTRLHLRSLLRSLSHPSIITADTPPSLRQPHTPIPTRSDTHIDLRLAGPSALWPLTPHLHLHRLLVIVLCFVTPPPILHQLRHCALGPLFPLVRLQTVPAVQPCSPRPTRHPRSDYVPAPSSGPRPRFFLEQEREEEPDLGGPLTSSRVGPGRTDLCALSTGSGAAWFPPPTSDYLRRQPPRARRPVGSSCRPLPGQSRGSISWLSATGTHACSARSHCRVASGHRPLT